MNLKIISIADNAIQIQLEREDYSIADIIHRELLNVKHVKFTGVPPPHPLIKTLTVQVHTDGVQPVKVVKEALELALANVDKLLTIAKENFSRQHAGNPPASRSA
ncbi:MAG: RpoL/Rpb11 RNA polymerase subunit family protein [Nitrososphaerales archaeon]